MNVDPRGFVKSSGESDFKAFCEDNFFLLVTVSSKHQPKWVRSQFYNILVGRVEVWSCSGCV